MNSITIRMPHADRELVLASLRLPENQSRQGHGYLFDGEGYCCLGLAQCAKTGGMVEAYQHTVSGDICYRGMPTKQWLNGVGWEFFDEEGNRATIPYFPSTAADAVTCNDVCGMTFAEIADLWERHSEGY